MIGNEKSAMFCQVLPVQGDLEKDEDIKALLEATIKHFGKLDILVRTILSLLMARTQPSFLYNANYYPKYSTEFDVIYINHDCYVHYRHHILNSQEIVV